MTAQKKKLTAQQKKWEEEFRKDFSAQLRARKKALFESTTIEQRKALIGFWHAGKKLGDAAAAAGLTLEQALVVITRNTKKVTYEFVLPVEKVV